VAGNTGDWLAVSSAIRSSSVRRASACLPAASWIAERRDDGVVEGMPGAGPGRGDRR